ncbi:MAG TPA: glycosyltransferase, partial [Candidatus Saccharimonas sp.]|nr:glycosyltransferase [Candidatus Saccharimonas sp.]
MSEHASPLATISGIDAGGQNRHVAGLAAALVAVGHEVTVYTRRDSMVRAGRISAPGGYEVVHVPVGPPEGVPKDELMPYMVPFGSWLSSRFAESKRRPDVVHAHFWMSGIAALRGAMPRQIPVVLTYHAHGNVKRRFQRQDDTSPAGRMSIERQLALVVQRVVAQCSDEVAELMALGVPATQIRLIPSGIDLNQFQPRGPTVNKTGPRLLAVGRPVPRKGFEEVI